MLRAFFSSMAKGPAASMTTASAGSTPRKCAIACAGSKPSVCMLSRALEQRAGAQCGRTLDFENAPFGGDAARGREAAHLAIGGQHAMAGHDDGDRIAAQRLADFARFLRRAQPPGDLAV